MNQTKGIREMIVTIGVHRGTVRNKYRIHELKTQNCKTTFFRNSLKCKIEIHLKYNITNVLHKLWNLKYVNGIYQDKS